MDEESAAESNLGNLIRRTRTARRMTQTEFAEALGVSLGTIGNWERGKTIPERWHPDIERTLGVTISMVSGPRDVPRVYAMSSPGVDQHTRVDTDDTVIDFGPELGLLTDPIERARVIAAARHAALKEISAITRERQE